MYNKNLFAAFNHDIASLWQVDKEMMDELKDVKRFLNPTETLLVVDAMTGQEAACKYTLISIFLSLGSNF